MIVANDYHELQQRLEYQFHDLTRLTLALSHRSCGNRNNERLEFLGDALLGFVVTDFLYSEFPQVREGDLSRMRSHIVRAESLAQVAKDLQLGQDLLLGQGEMKSGGQRRDSILGDTVEALIGAVYLDSDLDEARNCILRWFKPLLDAVEQVKPSKDPKTTLQEFLQQRGHQVPQYDLIETGGEAHSRLFTVSCEIDFFGRLFTATASSRRKAEQMVAEQFLAAMETGDDG